MPAEEVLIIRPGALGDTLMLLPLLAALEGSFEPVAAGRRPGIDVLRYRGIRCADVEAGGWHTLFGEEPVGRPAAVATLNPGRVLAFLNDPGGRVDGNLKRLFPEAAVRVFPGRPAEEGTVHAALHLARCAAGAGLPADPEGCVTEACERPLLEGVPGERAGLVVHPGSGGPRKNLSPVFWRAFLNRFRGESDIALLLGPAEEGMGRHFQDCGPIRAVLSPDTEDLLTLLGRAACCVGHDSGISHLAAMLGTPTVAVFKESNHRVWRPLGPVVRVLRAREEGERLLERVAETVGTLLGTRRTGPVRRDRATTGALEG
jgi:hypothetical protein